MISDKIENAAFYRSLGTGIAKGLALLGEETLRNGTPGRYDVDGENLYYVIDQYETMSEEQGRFEAHRKYIDIQFMVAGREWVGVRPLEEMEVAAAYDSEKDIAFYERPLAFSRIVLEKDAFAIFWPHDAHMPCRMFAGSERVKKIVVKVRCGR
jgi:biofilm protein TabA